MNQEELYTFLTSYTEVEKKRLAKDQQRTGYTVDESILMKDAPPSFLLDEASIIAPGESFGIIRQDRFRPVGSHSHTYIELNYVWSGWCVQQVKNRRIITRQGDICLMDPEAEHSVGICGENDIIINLLMPKKYFDQRFFARMNQQGILSRFLLNAVTTHRNQEHFLCFPTSENQRIRWIMDQILMEYYSHDLGRQEMLDSYMILLFTEMLRSFRDSPLLEQETNGVPIHQILSYIEQHCSDCTLSALAEHFGFHPVYLTTFLKEKTGKSFVEHLQNARLEQAVHLLLSTDLPIREIAEQVGYSNLHFFYQKFYRFYGCTPKEYRDKNQP